MFSSEQKKFPLHEAVLNKKFDAVKQLSGNPHLCEQKNHLGFTALDLSRLLDIKEAIKILGPDSPRSFKVMHEGDSAPIEYSIELLQKVFGFRYLSHLKFGNYATLHEVITNCPWILRTCIGRENRELAEKYQNELESGYVVKTTIKWIDQKIGYGLFADEDLPSGVYVGEYTGLVRRLYRSNPDHNPYCFQYPTKMWSAKYYVIDALWQGNETRFINHSAQPNLEPICLMKNRLLHMCFRANQAIPKGAELTFNYGPDFWN